MNKLILLGFIFSILLLSGTSQAQLGYFCEGDRSIHNWTVSEDAASTTWEIDDFCPYGCNTDNGICYNSTPDTPYTVAFIFLWFFVAFLMAYIAFNLNSEIHGILQIFFMVLALYAGLNMIGTAQVVAEISNVIAFNGILFTGLTVWIWSTVFVLFYLTIYFLYVTLQRFQGWYNKRTVRKKGDLWSKDEYGV